MGSACVRAGLEYEVTPEDHPVEGTDLSTLQKVQRSVTRIVRDLNTSRSGSRNQKTLPGHNGVFQGERGRDSICSVAISDIFLIEIEVRNRDINENNICLVWFNGSHKPWN